ncbi:hypothetical protein L873DRAFT_1785181 [Choiromyces venosus 120613-1]|uniref:Uncharacterized protein n=1 Tax=Choiromyces venosus 120613-1 TaxID=1336337 RepID=A0A3N4K669_9PEZI|nr:hypothetical protein L873DRAFT_1785181 [Choiromyces venosus 120613-1]
MSPTKSRPTLPRRAVPTNASSSASSIPRRVKQTTGPTKSRKPTTNLASKTSSKKVSSLLRDESVTVSPPKPLSYTSGANKENVPVTISQGRITYVGTSPSRQPTGVSKLPKSSLVALKKKAKGRIPLRELSEQEVFERDEAVLGDLRRRRSGEHGAFEVDSVLANTQASVNENGRETSVSSSTTHGSTSSQSTAATEVGDNDNGRIRVLKRSDSEEELRAKINEILENTASAKPSTNKPIRRKGLLTKATRLSPMKEAHPAVRQSSPSPKKAYHSEAASSSPGGAVYSCGSPFSSPLKTFNLPESPLRILRSPSPIVKLAPVRTGLGNKAINTIFQDKSGTDKGKKVIIASSNTNSLSKKTIAKKAGSGSLRRAAGPIRSAAASTISSTNSSRLDEMRKMR